MCFIWAGHGFIYLLILYFVLVTSSWLTTSGCENRRRTDTYCRQAISALFSIWCMRVPLHPRMCCECIKTEPGPGEQRAQMVRPSSAILRQPFPGPASVTRLLKNHNHRTQLTREKRDLKGTVLQAKYTQQLIHFLSVIFILVSVQCRVHLFKTLKNTVNYVIQTLHAFALLWVKLHLITSLWMWEITWFYGFIMEMTAHLYELYTWIQYV